jgi:hypothetical protein
MVAGLAEAAAVFEEAIKLRPDPTDLPVAIKNLAAVREPLRMLLHAAATAGTAFGADAGARARNEA